MKDPRFDGMTFVELLQLLQVIIEGGTYSYDKAFADDIRKYMCENHKRLKKK